MTSKSCPVTMEFLRFIFRQNFDFGLSYIQKLVCEPEVSLPTLALYSGYNGTGKTTFVCWLKTLISDSAFLVIDRAEFSALLRKAPVILIDEVGPWQRDVIEALAEFHNIIFTTNSPQYAVGNYLQLYTTSPANPFNILPELVKELPEFKAFIIRKSFPPTLYRREITTLLPEMP